MILHPTSGSSFSSTTVPDILPVVPACSNLRKENTYTANFKFLTININSAPLNLKLPFSNSIYTY